VERGLSITLLGRGISYVYIDGLNCYDITTLTGEFYDCKGERLLGYNFGAAVLPWELEWLKVFSGTLLKIELSIACLPSGETLFWGLKPRYFGNSCYEVCESGTILLTGATTTGVFGAFVGELVSRQIMSTSMLSFTIWLILLDTNLSFCWNLSTFWI
jgi:hypothetical protein